MAEEIMIPKGLISAKIVRIERIENHGHIKLIAKSEFGDEFELFFHERCGEVELEITAKNK
jgi:hypothetical protein